MRDNWTATLALELPLGSAEVFCNCLAAQRLPVCAQSYIPHSLTGVIPKHTPQQTSFHTSLTPGHFEEDEFALCKTSK